MKKKNSICIITTISISIKAFFIEQIEFLNENGYDVTVICSKDDELFELLKYTANYIPVRMNRGVDVLNLIKSVQRMYKIFKKNKFDIIQYSTPNASLYASIAGYLANIKVRNYHNMGYRYMSSNGIKRYILKSLEYITCLLSTHIENVSYSNLEFAVKEQLFSYEKSCVVWNGSTSGVNLKKFDFRNKDIWKSEILKKYNIGVDHFVFGFVGRITRDKGINELLLAFKNINLNRNVVLIIVGEEDDLTFIDDKLYDWAKNNKDIVFAGKTDEVYKYLAAFDVLVLPSYREGFGNVIIESQAMATPVITSDIPGPSDIVYNNKTGILVKPKDVNYLTEAMLSLYENKDKVLTMGQEGRNNVEEKFDQNVLMQYILQRKNRLIEFNNNL